MIEKE